MKKGSGSPINFCLVIFLPILLLTLSSYTLLDSRDEQDHQRKVEICKKESMLSVLESLEEGQDYEKPLEWKGRFYMDMSDFNLMKSSLNL